MNIRYLLIFLAVVVFALSFPVESEARGLLSCGGCNADPDPDTGQCPLEQEEPSCNLCHFFVLLSTVLNFLLVPSAGNGGFALIPILAALLLAIGGFYFFSAAGNPERLARGKQILFAAVIGMLIIYGSWVFINLLFTVIGVADWTGLTAWWTIQCGTVPLLSLNASPATVFIGESTALLWEPQGVTSCTASENWSGSKETFCSPTCSETVTPPSVLGSYEYVLTCTGLGGKIEGSVFVQVDHRAPIVEAGDNQAVFFPGSATLDATVTDDGFPNPPGAFTVKWSQEGGAGSVTFGDALAQDTTAAFSLPDTYVLRLTASDGEKESFDELMIVVSNLPPIAGITAVPLSGPNPMVSTFADVDPGVSGGGPITSWLWDFKDTSTSTLEDPGPHLYQEGGTYAVTLTVTGPGGTDTATETIVVDGVVEAMLNAIQLYYNDMGFYPPDPGRGADPGFTKPLPFNDDPLSLIGIYDCNIDFTHAQCQAFASQAHLFPGWHLQVLANWTGPYIAEWPEQTFWGGEYDYNYWASGAVRYGCTVAQGIYIGVQGDYSDGNMLPAFVEDQLVAADYDDDGCVNGEAQVQFSDLPIAHWYFNELHTGRTVVGVGSGSSDGTFFGETFEDGAVTNAPLTAGKDGFGNALDFNGIDRYVEILDSPRLDITNQITIEAWINLRELTGESDVSMILNKEGIPYEIAIHDNTGPDDIVHTCQPTIDLIPPQNFSFYLGGVLALPSHSCGWADGGGPVAKNVWTHVALTYDGSTARTYIGGVLQKTYAGLSGAINVNGCAARIGARGGCAGGPPPRTNQGALFNGKIDEVRIYDRALTASQIAEDMNSVYPIERPIASWSFENLAGGQTYDTHHIVQGKYRGAGSFDSVNDFVETLANISIPNSPITIGGWVQLDSVSPSPRQIIEFNTPGKGEVYIETNDGTAVMRWNAGAASPAVSPPVSLSPAWHHVVGTYDGAAQHIYIDGVLANTIPWSGTHDVNSRAVMGRDNEAVIQFWHGRIDDIKIWNRNLSATQVLNEFTNGP